MFYFTFRQVSLGQVPTLGPLAQSAVKSFQFNLLSSDKLKIYTNKLSKCGNEETPYLSLNSYRTLCQRALCAKGHSVPKGTLCQRAQNRDLSKGSPETPST
jgi:hypothetical protein